MDLIKIIRILEKNNLSKTVYFTRKQRNEYISYSPEVSDSVLNDLLKYIRENLQSYYDFEQIEFNPTGYREGTIETCEIEYVGNYNEVVHSFNGGNIEEIEIEADNFSFYCLDLEDEEGNVIKLFRRVTKFKRLYSKGIIAAFQGNRLNKIDNKMIGMDGQIDLIVFEGEIAVLNHISLERIFRLNEQFSTKAQEAINYIKRANKIVNFDSFEEDCLNDLRIHVFGRIEIKQGGS